MVSALKLLCTLVRVWRAMGIVVLVCIDILDSIFNIVFLLATVHGGDPRHGGL